MSEKPTDWKQQMTQCHSNLEHTGGREWGKSNWRLAQNTVILVEKEDKRLCHFPGSHSLVLPLMSGG